MDCNHIRLAAIQLSGKDLKFHTVELCRKNGFTNQSISLTIRRSERLKLITLLDKTQPGSTCFGPIDIGLTNTGADKLNALTSAALTVTILHYKLHVVVVRSQNIDTVAGVTAVSVKHHCAAQLNIHLPVTDQLILPSQRGNVLPGEGQIITNGTIVVQNNAVIGNRNLVSRCAIIVGILQITKIIEVIGFGFVSLRLISLGLIRFGFSNMDRMNCSRVRFTAIELSGKYLKLNRVEFCTNGSLADQRIGPTVRRGIRLQLITFFDKTKPCCLHVRPVDIGLTNITTKELHALTVTSLAHTILYDKLHILVPGHQINTVASVIAVAVKQHRAADLNIYLPVACQGLHQCDSRDVFTGKRKIITQRIESIQEDSLCFYGNLV